MHMSSFRQCDVANDLRRFHRGFRPLPTVEGFDNITSIYLGERDLYHK